MTDSPLSPAVDYAAIVFEFNPSLPDDFAANVALALARLGEETSFAGRLGPDVFGRRMREHLTSNGVDPRHLDHAQLRTEALMPGSSPPTVRSRVTLTSY